MAVERTGSVGSINSNTNTGNQDITVPSDATLLVVGAIGYTGLLQDYFSLGAVDDASVASVTYNGTQMKIGDARDDNDSYGYCCLFYLVNPTTGTHNLAWDWNGADAPSNGAVIFYAFYKGVDTTTPIRSRGGQGQGDADATTGSLTALSGDAIVAVAYADTTAAGISWTNATEISEVDYNNISEAYAEAFPSGDTTVTATTTATIITVSAIVIKAGTDIGENISIQAIG